MIMLILYFKGQLDILDIQVEKINVSSMEI